MSPLFSSALHPEGIENVYCCLARCRSLKKEAKLKEKKSNAWKQRQGEQKQQQAKKQKRYAQSLLDLAHLEGFF